MLTPVKTDVPSTENPGSRPAGSEPKPAEWIIPLARVSGRERALVGGKAANLGQMLQAGLPVPDGFCVTTAAFRLWIEGNREAGALLAHLEALSPDGASEHRDAAARLRQSLLGRPIPQVVREAIRSAAAQAGTAAEAGATEGHSGASAYAVRSSATAEDLAEASFAGQHDSLLDVRGPGPLLDAVRRCWVSLFSDRAVFYRSRRRIRHSSVAMAVVVQKMVPAEVSGVLFTADPVTGNSGRMVLEGALGLGESLVSGKINPARCVLDKERLCVIERGGSPQPSLDDRLVRQLGDLGLRAERLFGGPQDIEWAAHNGRVFLLQSRPITALPPAREPVPEGEPEVWTNANVMEALPDVVVPMAWSFMQLLLKDFLYPIMRRLGMDPGTRPLIGLIAGRAYLNLRALVELVGQASGPVAVDMTEAFGGMHSGLEQVMKLTSEPRRPLKGFRSLTLTVRLIWWLAPGLVGQPRLIRRWEQRTFADPAGVSPTTLSDEELAAHPLVLARRAVLRDGDRTIAAGVWMGTAAAGGSIGVFCLAQKWLGDTDRSLANRLLAGAEEMGSAENGLALLRLAAWARGHPELKQALLEPLPFAALEGRLAAVPCGAEFLERWRGFMEAYGHQARGGMDVFQPRWSEMPDFVLDSLRVYLQFDEAEDPLVLQARRRAERAALLAECRRRLRNPFKRWLFTFLVRTSRRGLAQRENIKNAGVRLAAIVRRTALEAGRRLAARGVLDRAEDVFFLQLDELGPVLLGRPPFEVASVVAARKAEYARQKLLSPPPVIVGDWEPVASEGSRPAGFEGPPGPDAAQAAGARTRSLQGLAVSPGLVTGKARVILQADIGERIQPGEILVAPYTDPGWTPYFLAAAGIVVDIGGLLSHGSVVAREYGLPAVVNVGPATRLIRTGQLIEVDGNRGVVTVLE